MPDIEGAINLCYSIRMWVLDFPPIFAIAEGGRGQEHVKEDLLAGPLTRGITHPCYCTNYIRFIGLLNCGAQTLG